jgi:CDP-diacylglycerol--glycerol-3-phosphate 3-phosphatidyltransferase
VDQTNQQKQKLTLSDRARVVFKGVLDPIGAFFNRLGIFPNTMTLLGLAGNVVGAILIALGYLTIGGIVVLVMGLVDTLDGTMATLS